MAFIRELKRKIDELMKENRRKRLDAEQNAILEDLFNQQRKEAQRLEAERKRKDKKQEQTAQPEDPKPAKVESQTVALNVFGGGHVTVARREYDSIKGYEPFFWHIAKGDSMVPATLYFSEGRKVVMPLQNICPSLKSSGFALDLVAPEPFTTAREYRKIQSERMKCLRERRKQ